MKPYHFFKINNHWFCTCGKRRDSDKFNWKYTGVGITPDVAMWNLISKLANNPSVINVHSITHPMLILYT